MGLEANVNHISDLNPLYPSENDPLVQGDNHIRFIKKALKNTFPNVTEAVSPTAAQINKLKDTTVSAAELNTLAGMTGTVKGAIETVAKNAEGNPNLIPIGGIFLWGGQEVPPSGSYMFCNGQAISRTTYATLFARFGTAYGAGNGTTTFNLPNFQSRTPIGVGTGSSLSQRLLGAMGGTEKHTLTVAQLPAHDHTFSGTTDSAGRHKHPIKGLMWMTGGQFSHDRWTTGSETFYTEEAGEHTHKFSGTTNKTGSTSSFDIMNPYIGVNFVVRVL